MEFFENKEIFLAFFLWFCALTSFCGALRFQIAKIVYNKFRKIDILINAAAITDAVEKKTNPEFSKFENFSLKDWSKSININFNSMFIC